MWRNSQWSTGPSLRLKLFWLSLNFAKLQDEVKKLAEDFGLLKETRTNPHLSFLGGDIAFWHEQELSEDRLKLEFAARKIVLEAADKQGVVIDDQGKLSWAAQRIMADMLRARAALTQDKGGKPQR